MFDENAGSRRNAPAASPPSVVHASDYTLASTFPPIAPNILGAEDGNTCNRERSANSVLGSMSHPPKMVIAVTANEVQFLLTLIITAVWAKFHFPSIFCIWTKQTSDWLSVAVNSSESFSIPMVGTGNLAPQSLRVMPG